MQDSGVNFIVVDARVNQEILTEKVDASIFYKYMQTARNLNHITNMRGTPTLNMSGMLTLNMLGMPTLNMLGTPTLNMLAMPKLNVQIRYI